MQPPLPAPDSLPDALLAWPNFVLWRYEERGGKVTKVPLTVHGRRAATTAPADWATIEEAYSAARRHGWGIGFVFSPADPFCGIDLDHVVVDGALASDAARIVGDLDTYTEFSPSGTGVHLICRAQLPPVGRRTGYVELYDRERFFTLTGQSLWADPRDVEDRQAEVAALHARLFPPPPPPSTSPAPTTGGGDLTDADLIERALGAANGAKFRRLWAGDTTGYGSHSEADAALCALLAFLVGGDPARVADLFRQSGLARPKFERRTYRDRTLAFAATCRAYYTPRPARRLVLSDTRGGR